MMAGPRVTTDRDRLAARSLVLGSWPRHPGCAGEHSLGVREARARAQYQHHGTRELASRRVMEKAGLAYRSETNWRGQDVVLYAIDVEGGEPAERREPVDDRLGQPCSSPWLSLEASAIAGRVLSMRKATMSRKSPLFS